LVFVIGRFSRDHHPMTRRGGGWMGAMAGLALAALAGCGPSSTPQAPAAAASNAAIMPASSAAVTLSLPPAPDPERDPRPDRVKFEDFADRLEKVQTDLARVDGALIPRVRAGLQSGDEAIAKAALADYRAQIAADVAAQPPPPRLGGCFAKAQALNAKAEAALAGMLSDRQAKAGAVAAITDRPLALADFGGLAAAITVGTAADDAKASLASARAAVDDCRSAAGASSPRRESAPAAPPTVVQEPSPQPIAPKPQAPPKKRGVFERMFGGGS
jgi:hypothetical protein